jgi:hypothetical protein
MADAKTLYHHALQLCDSYFEKKSGLANADGVVAMLIASQMLGASSFHVLEEHNVDLMEVSDIFREAMKLGSTNTVDWLNGLSNFFAVEQPDPVEASVGLALRAVNGAGGDQREALIRILAAAKMLARSAQLTKPEQARATQQAELLEARAAAMSSEEPSNSPLFQSSGGSA